MPQNVAVSTEKCCCTTDLEEMLQLTCCSVMSQPSWYCVIQWVQGMCITLMLCHFS